MGINTWFAKIRYPTPEEGDFADEILLDKPNTDDGDDNEAQNKEKP